MIAHTRLICVDLFVPEEAKDPDTGSVMNELPEEAKEPAQKEEKSKESRENRGPGRIKRPRNKVSSYIPQEKLVWIQYVF
jgi:hypothetical protein